MTDFSLLTRHWYRLNKRDLPWRTTSDPYKIWISEIILQQTRVDQGLNYYLKFIKNYPSVHHLASADEKQVLNDWQGLGYYSRARNLHATSKIIAEELDGNFPVDHAEIIKLKGVGSYTAAAIASFAYNTPYAVVDGNVYRVLSRYFDLEEPIDSSAGVKIFQQLADELLDREHPAEHNQAIMELGALICLPKQAKCEECPLISGCQAYANNTVASRPVKNKKTKVKQRYFHFFVVNEGGYTYIDKRTGKDIWQNMYQFPLLETHDQQPPDEFDLTFSDHTETMIHILTHQKITAHFHRVKSIPAAVNKNDLTRIKTSDIQSYPIPRLIDRYLDTYPLDN